MQSPELELILCRKHYLDAVHNDYLSAVAVLEKRIDYLLDSINKQRRRSR